MFKLQIPKDRITKTMEQSGYCHHISQHEGVIHHGFKLDIFIDHRWHAIIVEDGIEIHMDKTINGFHKVVSFQGMEKKERRKIEAVYKNLYPEKPHEEKLRMKIKKGGEFAPNLMELQRSLKKMPLPTKTILEIIEESCVIHHVE